MVLRSGYEWRGRPQAVSRESHRTRNKNKQTINNPSISSQRVAWAGVAIRFGSVLARIRLENLIVPEIKTNKQIKKKQTNIIYQGLGWNP
jgi:hypothetical protein